MMTPSTHRTIAVIKYQPCDAPSGIDGNTESRAVSEAKRKNGMLIVIAEPVVIMAALPKMTAMTVQVNVAAMTFARGTPKFDTCIHMFNRNNAAYDDPQAKMKAKALRDSQTLVEAHLARKFNTNPLAVSIAIINTNQNSGANDTDPVIA
jgi:hypothetical protein